MSTPSPNEVAIVAVANPNVNSNGIDTNVKLMVVIFLLFLASLYLGFTKSLDKNHILLLSLGFLTLVILMLMMARIDAILSDTSSIQTNLFIIKNQSQEIRNQTVLNSAILKSVLNSNANIELNTAVVKANATSV